MKLIFLLPSPVSTLQTPLAFKALFMAILLPTIHSLVFLTSPNASYILSLDTTLFLLQSMTHVHPTVSLLWLLMVIIMGTKSSSIPLALPSCSPLIISYVILFSLSWTINSLKTESTFLHINSFISINTWLLIDNAEQSQWIPKNWKWNCDQKNFNTLKLKNWFSNSEIS